MTWLWCLFNTRLLADLITGGLPPDDFGEIGSQVELLQLYWRRRVAQHGTAAELCLRRAVSEMVDGRALRANRLNTAGSCPAAFDALLRENVLVPLAGNLHVGFRHHILFDYAASRVYPAVGAPRRPIRGLIAIILCGNDPGS
jgi:hypothetical protein